MTVLVAAATRHGATAEIAGAIGRVLRERGVSCEVADVADVDSLAGYDAVVLGSAVYLGKWLEPARSFVDRHADELAARKTWLFSSGPVGDPPKPSPESAVELDAVVAKTSPVASRVFGGKVDRSTLGLAERTVLRAVRASEGDYRDWRDVRAFAADIADAVSG